MKLIPTEMFCILAQDSLNISGESFAAKFIQLKREFFIKYQNGLVFSTRFGADFFGEIAARLADNVPIAAERGEKIGEYDENFNKWLAMQLK